MKLPVFVSAVCLSAAAVAGNTCTWKDDALTTSTDWSDRANYVEGVAPVGGNGDTIVIPLGKTVTLKASDAASRAIVEGGFGTIKMIGRFGEAENPARMIVEVAAGDSDLTLNGPVLGYRKAEDLTNADAYSGLVVKKGAGALKLKPTLSGNNYYTSFEVREGDFYLPQDVSAKSLYNEISISNNATLHIAAGTNKQDVEINTLWGEGVVTNSHANGFTDIHVHILKECTFGGVIGNVRMSCKGGKLTLTGTNSTATSAMTADFNRSAGPTGNGVITFVKAGRSGEKSSLGTNAGFVFGQVGGSFVYAGTGEETDKTLRWQYPRTQMNFLSGGIHGGLVFDADSSWNIAYTKAASAGMASLGLSGDNATNVCVMAGSIARSVDDKNRTNRLYITKFGAGTWRFRDHATRTGVGGIAVREGTLQFDSLDEAGIATALGSATDVHTNYWGEYDAAAKSDHVFELGGDGTEGTLEFTGSSAVYCTTRPAVMKGSARFRNSTAQAFRFANVKNVSGAAQTLTLDGTGTGENVMADVVDTANAPVSVVKEGSGVWTLANTNVLHGSLTVKGGTLKVRNPAGKYTWYLWTVRGIIDSAAAATCRVSEFCLYRTNDLGRANGGLAMASNYAGIQAGEAAFMTRKTIGGAAGLATLFDGVNNNSKAISATVDGRVPTTDDSETALPIVMRFEASAPAIGRYDFSAHYGVAPSKGYAAYQYGCHPKSWTLRGSVDGLHWNELHAIDDATDRDCGMPVGLYDDRFYNAQKNTAETITTGTNAHVIASASASTVNPLEQISTVSVAADATLEVEGEQLELSKFKIDAAGMGTLRNFVFAETGSLTVANLPNGASVTLPGTYETVSGLENLANWTLVGDRRVQRRRVVVKDGKVTLVAPGMVLIVR